MTMTQLSRRSFVKLGGAAGLALLTGCIEETAESPSTKPGASHPPVITRPSPPEARLSWSDPATWGGRVPGRNDVAVVSQQVLLDVDTRVAGVVIEADGSLAFDPSKSRTLESAGNVVVRGRLTAHPSTHSVVHRLRFIEIDEHDYRGAAAKTIDSDVGLWVLGGGIMDLWGSTKLPWTRVEAGLTPGDRVLHLLQSPAGWLNGDEVVILPTSRPGTPGHLAFEERTIEAVDGNVVTLDRGLDHMHPAVEVGRGRTLAAEVLNLTRNVILSGTSEGRAHVIFTRHDDGTAPESTPQRTGYFRLEHMGPHNSHPQPVHFSEAVEASQPTDDRSGDTMEVPVLARWPLHFHHLEEASRGSLIEGAVAYRPSSHAFVAHQSHGVTFDGCIAYDSTTSPFWWDGDGKAPHPSRANVRPPDHTIDGLYRNCVAAKVRMFEGAEHLTFSPVWAPGWEADKVKYAGQLLWPGYTSARLGAFTLVKEGGNITGGVAAGVEGRDSGGVVWPAGAAGTRWEIEDLVVHNNGEHGTFGWHNTRSRHEVRRLVSYHNVKAGIFHGAYANPYSFVDCISYGNGTGVEWHANADKDADVPQEWTRLLCDGDWEAHPHGAGGERATIFRECEFRGELRLLDSGGPAPSVLEFIDCTYGGRPLHVSDLDAIRAHPKNRIEVRTEEEPVAFESLPDLPLPQLLES